MTEENIKTMRRAILMSVSFFIIQNLHRLTSARWFSALDPESNVVDFKNELGGSIRFHKKELLFAPLPDLKNQLETWWEEQRGKEKEGNG